MPEDEKWYVERNNKKYNLTFAHPGGGKVKLSLEREEINKLIEDLKKLLE
ncbi:hypothetical protein ES705_46030 [subsurface metagenome]